MLLVERVHGVRNLVVELDVCSLNRNTEAAYAAAHIAGQKSGVIFYNSRKSVSCAAFLEEFGHALDHQAFNDRLDWASETGDSDIEEVIRAIRASPTFQRVRGYRLGMTIDLRQLDKTARETITNGKTLEYEQRIEEWFARAYVQFIAISSGDESLLQELATLRTSEMFELLYPYAWPDEEFEPIARGMERVFRRKGWIV
jgi:hypothetical protein